MSFEFNLLTFIYMQKECKNVAL